MVEDNLHIGRRIYLKDKFTAKLHSVSAWLIIVKGTLRTQVNPCWPLTKLTAWVRCTLPRQTHHGPRDTTQASVPPDKTLLQVFSSKLVLWRTSVELWPQRPHPHNVLFISVTQLLFCPPQFPASLAHVWQLASCIPRTQNLARCLGQSPTFLVKGFCLLRSFRLKKD